MSFYLTSSVPSPLNPCHLNLVWNPCHNVINIIVPRYCHCVILLRKIFPEFYEDFTWLNREPCLHRWCRNPASQTEQNHDHHQQNCHFNHRNGHDLNFNTIVVVFLLHLVKSVELQPFCQHLKWDHSNKEHHISHYIVTISIWIEIIVINSII